MNEGSVCLSPASYESILTSAIFVMMSIEPSPKVNLVILRRARFLRFKLLPCRVTVPRLEIPNFDVAKVTIVLQTTPSDYYFCASMQ